MADDVEMKDASTDQHPNQEPLPKPNNVETSVLVFDELKSNIALLEKAALLKETRFLSRVLRKLASIKRKLTKPLLIQLINSNFSPNSPVKDELLAYLSQVTDPASPTSMEVETRTIEEPQEKKKIGVDTSITTQKTMIPEVELYIQLLVTIFLIDQKSLDQATACSSVMMKRGLAQNRRTSFPLAARAYFYYSRSFELTNRLSEIRGTLLAAHRTCSLRHDDEGQATILNLLLRNYLHYNLYDQADKLVSKTSFPEGSASSSQFARYLYYQGRIKSTQLDYTEAYECLVQANRKAPQTSARGFRIAVHKLLCIVQLLMGEIPERSVFRQPGLIKPLKPYLQLTQAVRVGDLATFREVVDKFADVFCRDKTYTLIQRLRHNVIKTGLRKINASYSRIYMSDICTKLHLDSVDDAEFIVAKAIRDGVIDALIDHEGGYIQSRENVDIYSTQEPMEAFHKRITFCLNIHNEAIKAMRFPPDAHKPNKESEEARKERLKQEQELANHLAEEEEDDDEF